MIKKKKYTFQELIENTKKAIREFDKVEQRP